MEIEKENYPEEKLFPLTPPDIAAIYTICSCQYFMNLGAVDNQIFFILTIMDGITML